MYNNCKNKNGDKIDMNRKILVDNLEITEKNPTICVPVTASCFNELIFQIKKITDTEADIIEWRADFYTEDILEALPYVKKNAKEKKLIFTFRTKTQGGERDNNEYFDMLKQVICSKIPDIVDIEILIDENEIKELIHLCKENNIVSILSKHFFNETPKMSKIEEIYDYMQSLGADIPKLAVMPQKLSDVLCFMETVSHISEKNSPIIAICMGKIGMMTRLFPSIIGSALSFATVFSSSAPGQLPVNLMKEIINKTR